MLSEKQRLEKENRVRKVVVTFLKSNKTIKELEEELHIPHSTIQRDLNDKKTIISIFPYYDAIINEIQIKLDQNKQEGLSLGGSNFAKNNISTKDELGHFTGSKKK